MDAAVVPCGHSGSVSIVLKTYARLARFGLQKQDFARQAGYHTPI